MRHYQTEPTSISRSIEARSDAKQTLKSQSFSQKTGDLELRSLYDEIQNHLSKMKDFNKQLSQIAHEIRTKKQKI
jgi:hypothetical protein